MRGISLTFRGQSYRIAETAAFAAGEEVEDIVTLGELSRWSAGQVRFRKLARAFATLLRAAGARVTDEDVHDEMMADVRRAAAAASRGERPDTQAATVALAAQAVQALVAVLMNGAPDEFMGAAKGSDDSPPEAARPS